jgi:hypothetical protein
MASSHSGLLVNVKRLAAASLSAGLMACASPDPVAYSGLASSSHLVPSKQRDSAATPFRYATPVEWRAYNRMIVDPVAIYRGGDHQFEDLSEQDKAELANYIQSEFREKLRDRFILVTDPAPDTLRLKLTLTGAATSTPVLSTLSRLDLAGGLYNGVQAVRGGEGMLTGSVIYAVEIYDAQTDRLLAAFVTKQYPGAFNIGASIGYLAAAKTGIDKGADALVAYLKK